MNVVDYLCDRGIVSLRVGKSTSDKICDLFVHAFMDGAKFFIGRERKGQVLCNGCISVSI